MKTKKIIGCLVAALAFIAPMQSISAQQDFSENSDIAPKNRLSGDIYRTDMAERMPLAYPHLEERDVLWEKRLWREIDVRELRNHHFAYEKRHLVNILFDAFKSGKINAYSALNDEFTDEMSFAELNKIINRCDTTYVTDPETGIARPVPITDEFDPKSVVRYRIKEVVYFDSKLGRLNTRILGIAPIMNRFDDNGNFIAAVPVCWFYYNDLRPVLAKEPMFSAQTDTRGMSWDDVFQSRVFASYITKESNVKDARLQDLYSGIDVLYEGEKIKEGIRNYEADLFSEGN